MSTLQQRHARAAQQHDEQHQHDEHQQEELLQQQLDGDDDAQVDHQQPSEPSEPSSSSSSSSASSYPPSVSSSSTDCPPPPSIIPFIILFFCMLCPMSYLTTSTPFFGLQFRHISRVFARPQIFDATANVLRADALQQQQAQAQQQPDEPHKPYVPITVTRPDPPDPKALYFTLSELAQFDGRDDGPVFLAVRGRIFDVSAGRHFYGPEKSYHNLAGKDCSRAFATSCYNNDKLHDLRGLKPEQWEQIDHWYKFYNEHEVYRPVGWVVVPDIPEDEPLPNDQC